MVILVSVKYMCQKMIKKRQLLPALSVPLPIDVCLLVYAVPATFQRCMTAIFSDFYEKIVEVFMDYFSVYGTSFDDCLSNLDRVLQRCGQTNLVFNWEK